MLRVEKYRELKHGRSLEAGRQAYEVGYSFGVLTQQWMVYTGYTEDENKGLDLSCDSKP